MSNKKKSSGDIVYSTDPSFKTEEENKDIETLAPARQRLRIRLETKHRSGKAVTIVDGFIGKNEDAELLGKSCTAERPAGNLPALGEKVFLRGARQGEPGVVIRLKDGRATVLWPAPLDYIGSCPAAELVIAKE